ncbi:hypothetical protein [Leuconostoc gasicomitatum]|uniref:hypothetical protein n=1 Tax=Leuconostoc gasicomitatum TaxID=115778 RepID=UPI000B7EA703|nr:hypothetical protein [Leuconostoc gasicomitatum]
MKIIHSIVAVWLGLSLMGMFVFIPLKEGFMNNILGWSIYILMVLGLVVWVIYDIKKPVDEDFEKTLIILFPVFLMVTILLLIYFFGLKALIHFNI